MKATWILPDGREITAEVKEGLNLMEAAVANNIPNVIGECGGNLSCATCHVYVAEDWLDKLHPPREDELDLLDTAPDVRDNSRLSCQILMAEELDGLKLTLAPGSEP